MNLNHSLSLPLPFFLFLPLSLSVSVPLSLSLSSALSLSIPLTPSFSLSLSLSFSFSFSSSFSFSFFLFPSVPLSLFPFYLCTLIRGGGSGPSELEEMDECLVRILVDGSSAMRSSQKTIRKHYKTQQKHETTLLWGGCPPMARGPQLPPGANEVQQSIFWGSPWTALREREEGESEREGETERFIFLLCLLISSPPLHFPQKLNVLSIDCSELS
jgi:hypothetical protein